MNRDIKNKIIKNIDTFNGNLFDFLDSLDQKCTNLGDFFIKKYKYYFSPNRYNRAHYNDCPLSPDEYEQVTIPILNNDDENHTHTPTQSHTQKQTQTLVSKYTQTNSISTLQPKTASKTKTKSKSKSLEMVEKHIVDNKESFLDENVWDILNDV